MTTKEKFKYFFKWTKIVLIEAFGQLQKKYQELEKQNKEQREEIIRLKAELKKIKIKSINSELLTLARFKCSLCSLKYQFQLCTGV